MKARGHLFVTGVRSLFTSVRAEPQVRWWSYLFAKNTLYRLRAFEKESDCCDLQVGVSPSPDRHHEQGGAGTGQAVPRLALYHSAATNFLQASCHSLCHSAATHFLQASWHALCHSAATLSSGKLSCAMSLSSQIWRYNNTKRVFIALLKIMFCKFW